MSFRQDRTNPSTAVSNWEGRSETPKGHPSTAISTWINGGLFSTGGDNWVWKWFTQGVSPGSDPGTKCYAMRYQVNAGDDFLWLFLSGGQATATYLNMTTLEFAGNCQVSSVYNMRNVTGLYFTSWFGSSAVGGFGYYISGSNYYANWNEGFSPSSPTTLPANYGTLYWTLNYPYYTVPSYTTQNAQMGYPGSGDDARYFAVINSHGGYYGAGVASINMNAGSGATANWGRTLYRSSWYVEPMGMYSLGNNSSGYTYLCLGCRYYSSQTVVNMYKLNNSSGTVSSDTGYGDTNYVPWPSAMELSNHDAADHFYVQTHSRSGSTTYNHGHMLKFSAALGLTWQRRVQPGSPTTDLTTLGQVAADSDGNVFGMFRSYDTQTNSGTARDRIWIVKWDKAGTYQWHRALYQTRATGGYAMNVDAAECTPDGDLLLGISGTDATQGFQGTFFFKGDGSGAGTFNLNTGVDIKYDDSLVLNESAGALPWAASGSTSGGSPQISYSQASTQSMTPNDRVKTDF